MDSLIYKLQKKRATLSKLEKQVLEYIFANPHKIVKMRIDDLAKELFLSTATISRAAKRLGFKGYQELKFTIIQNLKEDTLPMSDPHTKVKISDYKETVISEIETALEGITDVTIQEIVELLKQAKSIEFFAVGGSYVSGLSAARKMTELGIRTSSHLDWDHLKARSKMMDPNQLAILISLSGETSQILEYGENLVESKVPTLAFIGTEKSSLEAISDYSIVLSSDPIYIKNVDLKSRYLIDMMLDYILMLFAGEKATKE